MKLLNALVLAFFPFAAAAQTFDTSTIPSGCRDNHFLPMQGSMPVQIIQPTHDERGAAILDPNPIASTGTEKGDRAVQPTEENQSVKSSTSNEDDIEQGNIPAQTEQATSEERGAAMLDPDRIASTGTEKGDRAVQPTQEKQSVKSSTSSEDELTVNGPIEQGNIPAQTEQATSEERGTAMLDPDRIASTGTETGDRAVQPTQEKQSVKSSTSSEDELTVNGPIEQGNIPAQTEQATSEQRGAAMLDPDRIASTGTETGDRAVQPTQEKQSVKSSTSSEDELTVNGPIEQGNIPAQTEQAISEERGAAMLDPDRIASTGIEKGDRAVQPTQEKQSVKSSTSSEDELTVNGPIEQGNIPAQTEQATSEERGAAMLDPDRIASTGTETGDRAVQPTQEKQSVKSSTSSEDELTVNGPIEQGTPAQTEQATSEQRGAAMLDPDRIASTGTETGDRAVQPTQEKQSVKSSTSSEDELTVNGPIEQGNIPAQTAQAISEERGAAMLDPDRIASTGTETGDRAVQPTQEKQSVKSSTSSEDELTVNGPIEQGNIPAQTEQATSEERGAAMLDPNPVASTGSEKADRIPAGAVQAADEPQTVESSTSSYEP